MSKSFVLCFSIFSFCFAGLYCEQEWKSETREIAKEMSGLTKTKTDIRNGLKTSISRYILNNFEIDKKIALEQSFSKRVPMCLRFKSKAFLGLVKDSIPGWPVYISEEKTKQLYSMVKELSDEIGMPVPKIFFINNFFNAFATSLTQNFSLICLGGDLVKELNDDELRCIIAHELGHIKKYHVLKSLAFLKVTSKLFNSAFNRLMPHLCEVDYSKEKRNFVFRRDVSALEVKKINAKIKWIGKGYRLTHASLLCLYYRSNEKQADIIAARATNDPESVISAFEKIKDVFLEINDHKVLMEYIRDSLAQDTELSEESKKKLLSFYTWMLSTKAFLNKAMYYFCHYYPSTTTATHPTFEKRIKYIKKEAEKMGIEIS